MFRKPGSSISYKSTRLEFLMWLSALISRSIAENIGTNYYPYPKNKILKQKVRLDFGDCGESRLKRMHANDISETEMLFITTHLNEYYANQDVKDNNFLKVSNVRVRRPWFKNYLEATYTLTNHGD